VVCGVSFVSTLVVGGEGLREALTESVRCSRRGWLHCGVRGMNGERDDDRNDDTAWLGVK
jgi:hypothetical protein